MNDNELNEKIIFIRNNQSCYKTSKKKYKDGRPYHSVTSGISDAMFDIGYTIVAECGFSQETYKNIINCFKSCKQNRVVKDKVIEFFKDISKDM